MKTTIQNISLIILVINCLVYIGYIVWRYGVQKSVSFSFYKLPKKLQPWFRAFIWTMSAMIMIIGWFDTLAIIQGLSLSIVGIFPRVKVGWKKVLHVIGAVTWIASSFVDVLIKYEVKQAGWEVIGLFAGSCAVFYLINEKKCLWWIENVAVLILIIQWAHFVNM